MADARPYVLALICRPMCRVLFRVARGAFSEVECFLIYA
jgi:hypothetical protein